MTLPDRCIFILPLLALAACHQGPAGKTAAAWPGIPNSVATTLSGTYSGNFKKGLLTLVINYVSGNTVSGYDLHRGIRRNLNGDIAGDSSRYSLVLKEPGGSANDGTFYLVMDKSGQKISGNWVPNDSTLVHSGSVNLSRIDRSSKELDDFYYAEWNSSIGSLHFMVNSACKLEYYPDSSDQHPNVQLTTVNGNFIRKGDTVLIDWQNNQLTPSLHMRLIRHPEQQISEDLVVMENLQGGGVKFVKIVAG